MSQGEAKKTGMRATGIVASILAIAQLIGGDVAAIDSASAGAPNVSDAIAFGNVQPILIQHCVMCHTQKPLLPAYRVAPDGVTFDSSEEFARIAPRVLAVATLTDQMPPGNVTGMTDAQRKQLAAAIEAQWPQAGQQRN